jgi:purine-binding chemotaxis protein CheW
VSEPPRDEPYVIVEATRTCFAVPQRLVREIVPARRLTRVPGAPAAVRGLLNVRGGLVTVLDLAAHFGVGRCEGAESPVVIAVTDTRTLGLLVDDVLDVAPLAPDAMLPPSAGDRAQGASGLGHFGDRIVLAVDLQELARLVLA